MVAHALGVLTLIKNLRLSHPDIIQPWCDEYSGALCMFRKREDYINSLKQAGLDCSYFPELTKSVIIVHLDNIEAEIFSASITGLSSAQDPIIWVVLSGIKLTNGGG